MAVAVAAVTGVAVRMIVAAAGLVDVGVIVRAVVEMGVGVAVLVGMDVGMGMGMDEIAVPMRMIVGVAVLVDVGVGVDRVGLVVIAGGHLSSPVSSPHGRKVGAITLRTTLRPASTVILT